ncbi:hypothetical protein M501DRAFT_994726 [Patellaria atrata CBS 101060]|uniref:Uncharacterized protein n=1 Tax=Patellaria atrata CBS 101060 TaxID=1346257 RepID=A0A9P4SJG3_9PEZI|nr:hypothetical protein M501DRAFT_994726 [Patellaria atrata CBS 101060]
MERLDCFLLIFAVCSILAAHLVLPLSTSDSLWIPSPKQSTPVYSLKSFYTFSRAELLSQFT